jgi:hypothetical protein
VSPGEKPTKYKLLHRVNSSDEISIETETIDASALEDKIERTIAGRGSTGGTFGVVSYRITCNNGNQRTLINP